MDNLSDELIDSVGRRRRFFFCGGGGHLFPSSSVLLKNMATVVDGVGLV